jgi:hypothetical protein
MNDTKTGSMKTNWSGVWGGKRVTLLVCLLLFTVKAFAGNGKLSKDLQSSTGSQPIDVIVQYATTPASKHFSKATAHGAKLKKQFASSNGVVYTLTPAQASQLADDQRHRLYLSRSPGKGARDVCSAV